MRWNCCAGADLTAVPAGAGWHAVSVRGAAETRLWPSFAVDFLTGCSEFKPLSGHLREYARYHSSSPRRCGRLAIGQRK